MLTIIFHNYLFVLVAFVLLWPQMSN